MDTLDRIHNEIAARVAELEPLVGEFRRLQQAHAALSAPAGTSRGRGAERAPAPPATRRRAGRGSARESILAAAQQHPEAKRGEIASLTGLPARTVGTTLAKLRAEGLLPRPARRAPDTASPSAPDDEPSPADAVGGEVARAVDVGEAPGASDADRPEAGAAAIDRGDPAAEAREGRESEDAEPRSSGQRTQPRRRGSAKAPEPST